MSLEKKKNAKEQRKQTNKWNALNLYFFMYFFSFLFGMRGMIGTNSTLRIQSKQPRKGNIKEMNHHIRSSFGWTYEKKRYEGFCCSINYWLVTTAASSMKSSGFHGNISSSTSFEQSHELRRIMDVSSWCLRGANWNAAFTESLKKIK